MKKKMLECVVYEPGDILDMKNVNMEDLGEVSRASKKVSVLANSRIVVVLDVNTSQANFLVRYKILSQNGKTIWLPSRNLINAKYVKHSKEFEDFFNVDDNEEESEA